MNSRWSVVVVWFFLVMGGCSFGESSSSSKLLALTYNVAGVPKLLVTSHPDINMPRISPLLNRFDLVLLQEDFIYHRSLTGRALHRYRSTPKRPVSFVNDGLNRLSRFPFFQLHREAWRSCHGILENRNDCFTDKGFSVALHELTPGVFLDIYNLHMDAGRSWKDHRARAEQIDQLLAVIRKRSPGMPVIVAGDFNLIVSSTVDDAGLLERLLAEAGLTDASQELEGGRQSVDRFLYRGSEGLQLRAVSWEEDARFIDEDGNDLSDHKPFVVEFAWKKLENGWDAQGGVVAPSDP